MESGEVIASRARCIRSQSSVVEVGSDIMFVLIVMIRWIRVADETKGEELELEVTVGKEGIDDGWNNGSQMLEVFFCIFLELKWCWKELRVGLNVCESVKV